MEGRQGKGGREGGELGWARGSLRLAEEQGLKGRGAGQERCLVGLRIRTSGMSVVSWE